MQCKCTMAQRDQDLDSERETHRGMVLVQPEEPLPSECCGSGCEPCVMDVYQNQLETWKTLQSLTPDQRVKWFEEKELREDKEKRESLNLLPAFSHNEYRSFILTEMTPLTLDTILYTFSISPDHSVGLLIGQHILLRVNDGINPPIVRQYTPISPLNSTDTFQIAIKVYENGVMSQHVKNWIVGSTALWRGLFGKLVYSTNQYSHIGMLACGTGIAPMIQVIRTIVENEEEDTFVKLVYACRSQYDIILKNLLDEWTSHWNFSVVYALSRSSRQSVTDNPGSIRYGDRVLYQRVNGEIVKREMPPSSSGRSFIMVCGTDTFSSDMITHLTTIAGYPPEKIHKF